MQPSNQSTDPFTEAATLENIGAFLRRFEATKSDHTPTENDILAFLRRFESAKLGPTGLQEKEKQWESTVAPRFNIFQVLRIERKETTLHSRFLKELLHPKGSHSQGDFFLRGFLEVVERASKRQLLSFAGPKDLSGWEVDAERHIQCPKDQADRMLDLVLEGNLGRKKFFAVIENKIDARESDSQCSDYEDWLRKTVPCGENSESVVIFLTPDGRIPRTSTSGKWICLSYRREIRTWLEDILKTANFQAAHLRTAIEQYLQIVKSL